VIWTGEDGSRFYAQGSGETRKAYRLLKQAALASDPVQRRAVARRMFARRFNEALEPDLTMEQLRGMEGVRMRNAYHHISRRYGVKWRGRRYNRYQWDAADPINRALSAANALLNGICHTAVVSGGYLPSLGFIHSGKYLSFVYDIADLYKTEISIPAAFQAVALNPADVEAEVRRRCRERFREVKLLERILPDIDALLEISKDPSPDYDSDGALPAPLIGELDSDDTDEERST
jgi:CRISPR-associated protein Cas1